MALAASLLGCRTPAVPTCPKATACASSTPRRPAQVLVDDHREGRHLDDPESRSVLLAASIDPDKINCNADVIWIAGLRSYAKQAKEELAKLWSISPPDEKDEAANRIIMGFVVRMLFERAKTQNLGVAPLKGRFYLDADGRRHPLLMFRSGVTTDATAPNSCLRTLIRHGGVKHVLNLYGGDFPLHDFIRAESRVTKELGATHFDFAQSGDPGKRWRSLIRSPDSYEKNRIWAMKEVAKLIRSQIFQPGGNTPHGNVYFHCGGGMHRSGMIFGVLRRCINKDPMDLIEREYKRHTAYKSPEKPGGFEALNLRFIREFDCSLLH